MDNEKVYVEIHYSHMTFTTGRTAIISVDRSENKSEFIETYFAKAKQKLSRQIGIDESEIAIFNWSFLGPGVVFVD